MDGVIQQFLNHVSPQTLIDYRDVVRRTIDFVDRPLISSIFHGCVDANEQSLIGTGSFVEGANMARVFCEDESVANELEYDFMFQLMILDEQLSEHGRQVFEVVPIEECPAFVHIHCHVTAEQRRQSGHKMGKTEEDMNEVFVAKGHDRFYVSSLAARDNVARQFTALMGYFSNVSCTTGTTEMFDITKGNASIMLSIRFPTEDVDAIGVSTRTTAAPIPLGFVSSKKPSRNAVKVYDRITHCPNTLREACRPNELPTSDENRLNKYIELIQRRVDNYVRQAKDVLTAYDALVSQFHHMSGAGHPLEDRTSKANEIMRQCVKMKDFLLYTRKSTVGFLVRKQCDFNFFDAIIDDSVDHNLEQLLKQLEYSEEEGAKRRLETALDFVLQSQTKNGQATVAFRAGMDLLVDGVRFLLYQLQLPGPTQLNTLRKMLGTTVRHLSFDFVPCLRLQNWPSVAREWIERRRVWPELEVVRDIVNSGIHLVVKTHCHDDIDWRLSFSIAEVRLAGLWTPWQHYVYFVFKSLFYKFIKPLDKNNLACGELTLESANRLVQSSHQPKKFLTTFLAKTVMLHVSERSRQTWWNEANASDCITVLLFALLSAFETRNLPHYFVSSVNLLQGIPDDLANLATRAIEKIFDNKWATEQLANHFHSMKILLDAVDDQKLLMTYIETGLNKMLQRCTDALDYYQLNPVNNWQTD